MKIAYDCKLDRPGCVNIAAGLGTDTRIVQQFPPKSWLTFLTDDMKIYTISHRQLEILIARNEERFGI